MIQQMIYKGTAKGYRTVAASGALADSALLHRLELLCRMPGSAWVNQESPCPVYSRCALEEGIAVGLTVKDAHDDRNRSLSHIFYVEREDIPGFAARMLRPESFRDEYVGGEGGALPEFDVEADLEAPRLDAFPEAAEALFGGAPRLLSALLSALQLLCEPLDRRGFNAICVNLPELEARQSLAAYRLMEVLLRVYRRAGTRSIGYRTLWTGPENSAQYPIFFTSPRYLQNAGGLTAQRCILLDVAGDEARLPRRVELSPGEAEATLAEALLRGSADEIANAIRFARTQEQEQIRRAEAIRLQREREERERQERERLRREQEERERQERERLRREQEEQERQERERQEREELERLLREQEEKARREREEQARQEQERLHREQEEQERLRRELEEKARLALQAREERERREREEQERLRRELEEQARQEREERARREQEEQERQKREREEKERQERERLQREQQEQARRERERLQREREEKERQEQERQKREREEKERQERERQQREQEEKERREQEEKRRKDEEARERAAIDQARRAASARMQQDVRASTPIGERYDEAITIDSEASAEEILRGHGIAWGSVKRAILDSRGREFRQSLRNRLREIQRQEGAFALLCASEELLGRIEEAVLNLTRRYYEFEQDYMKAALTIADEIHGPLFSEFFVDPGRSGAPGQAADRTARRCMSHILLLCGAAEYPVEIEPDVRRKLADYDVEKRAPISSEVYRMYALWRILYSVYYGYACDFRDLKDCRVTLSDLRDSVGPDALRTVRQEISRQALWHMERYPAKNSRHYRAAVTACYYAGIRLNGEFRYPQEIEALLRRDARVQKDIREGVQRVLSIHRK